MTKRAAAIGWEPNNKVRWHRIEDAKPRCSSEPDSFGVQVLIWPAHREYGASPSPIAFYGKRVTDEPNFYLRGAVIYPTHWAHLPSGPK